MDIATFQLPDDCTQIALCGGPYSNFAAVEAFLEATLHLSYRFCLGDIGGFGPHPNRTIQLLRNANVICLQGNYDRAVGRGERDCGCGYLDPRDREFAQISYDYTFAHTDAVHRDWMCQLPNLIRLKWRDTQILLCHGSPVQVNEFVWESETKETQILNWLDTFQVDGICATHTGIPWISQAQKQNGKPGFWFNVGVLGRPAHEGKTYVYYGLLDFPESASLPTPRIVPLAYNFAPVVTAMKLEGLPIEFSESLETGIWTTCAEILPEAEKVVRPRLNSEIGVN